MDAYSILGVERRLVIEEEELDRRYRALSKSVHPDAGGSASGFEAVRGAYDQLKSPVGRLKEALGESAGRGAVPSEVMDFFGPVAEVVQEVDGFLVERHAARSGLGRAVLDARVPGLKARVERMTESLAGLEEVYVGQFESFDERGWDECRPEMEEVARGLAFLTKWQAQLREVVGKLFQALLGG